MGPAKRGHGASQKSTATPLISRSPIQPRIARGQGAAAPDLEYSDQTEPFWM